MTNERLAAEWRRLYLLPDESWPDADDAALRSALESVDAWDWASGLPDGLATQVGSGGHDLTHP